MYRESQDLEQPVPNEASELVGWLRGEYRRHLAQMLKEKLASKTLDHI